MLRFISTFSRNVLKITKADRIGCKNHINRSFSTENKTFLDEEIQKFNDIKDWWNINGSQAGLHGYNNLRVDFIKKNLAKSGTISPKFKFQSDLKVVDAGCGAGILSEVNFTFLTKNKRLWHVLEEM